MAYRRLRNWLGLPRLPIRVYDPVQQLAIVDDDILDRFGVDTIELGRGFADEDEYWREWELPDGTECLMPAWAMPERRNNEWVLLSQPNRRVIARMPAGVWYFEQANFPFLERENLERVEDGTGGMHVVGGSLAAGADSAGSGGEARLAKGAKALRARTERAILGLFGGNLLELGQWFYRNDNFFMLLAGEPDRAHLFLDALMAIHVRNLEHFLRAVGDSIQCDRVR